MRCVGRPAAFALTLALSTGLTLRATADDFPTPGGAQGAQSTNVFQGLAAMPDANLFSAAAGTSISIAVPPGRLNMTPEVTLNYSSTGGRSDYGLGWALNLGRIVRSTKYGLPAYDNTLDTFVIELPGKAIELVKDGVEPNTYHAEYEGSHLKIGFDQQANYWTVIDKNGVRMQFGKMTLRRTRLGPDTGHSESTYAWLLDWTKDLFGNQVDYYYLDTLAGDGGPRGLIDRIEYGKGANGIGHLFSVTFDWVSHAYPSEPIVSHSAGFPQYSGGYHLDRITTELLSNPQQPIREYTFDYDYDESASGSISLRAVTLTGYDENGVPTTAPPSLFEYAPPVRNEPVEGEPFQVYGWPVGSKSYRRGKAILVEDPITDPREHAGFRDMAGQVDWDVLDINGDGLVDRVYTSETHGSSVWLGTKTLGFDPDPTPWNWPVGYDWIRRTSGGDLHSALFDVTGDGLPDLVDSRSGDCEAASGDPWRVFRNMGDGFSAVEESWTAPRNCIQVTTGYSLTRMTLDMNGDGYPDYVDSEDFVAGTHQYWTVYPGGPTGFDVSNAIDFAVPDIYQEYLYPGCTGQPVSITRAGSKSTEYGLIDINGDGLPDLVHAAPSSVPDSDPYSDPYSDCSLPAAVWAKEKYWNVYFNTGTGFELQAYQWKVEDVDPQAEAGPLPNFYTRTGGGDGNSYSRMELIDMNGDGLLDLVKPWLDEDDAVDTGISPPTCPSGQGTPLPACSGGQLAPDCCQMMLVFVNTGSSFSAPVGWPAWSPYNQGTGNFTRYTTHNYDNQFERIDWDLFDFDGDGLVDLIERDWQTNLWYVYRHPAAPADPEYPQTETASLIPTELRAKPGLLTSMLNGIGGQTLLEYLPISRIPDQPCQYSAGQPIAGTCIPFPYWALTLRQYVESFAATEGGESFTTYAYKDGLYNASDREFRGFGTVWSVDPVGRSTATEFHQDDARKGLVYVSYQMAAPTDSQCGRLDPYDYGPLEQCNPWNHLTSETVNYWPDLSEIASGADLLLKRQVVTPFWRSNGQTTPQTNLAKEVEYQYDAYGNEALKVVDVTDPTFQAVFGQRIVTETVYEGQEDVLNASNMPKRYVVNRPTMTRGYYADSGSTTPNGSPFLEKRFVYGGCCNDWRVSQSKLCMSWSQSQPDTCEQWATTQLQDYSSGVPRREITPLGNTITKDFDAYMLYPELTTNVGTGLSETSLYDIRTGLLESGIDAAGYPHLSFRDGLGRLTQQLGPDHLGQPTWELLVEYEDATLSPSSPGYVKTMPQGGVAPAVVFYDGKGRPLATKTYVETDPATATYATVISGMKIYNQLGQVKYEWPPYDVTTLSGGSSTELTELIASPYYLPPEDMTEYRYDDATGDLTETVFPDQTTKQQATQYPGVTAVADPNWVADNQTGAVSLTYTDNLGRVVRSDTCASLPDLENQLKECPQPDLLARTQFVYDALDRLAVVIEHDLDSAQTYISSVVKYDGLGDVVDRDDVDSGQWSYTYNAAGLLEQTTSPEGRIQTRLYDSAGRLTDQFDGVSQVGATYSASFTYVPASTNGAGGIETVTSDGPAVDTFKLITYTARSAVNTDSLTVTSDVGGQVRQSSYTTTRTYDGVADRLATITYPAADGSANPDETITNVYGALGSPYRVVSDSGQTYVADVDYDVLGHVVKIEYGNTLADYYGYRPRSQNSYLQCIQTATAGYTEDPCAAASGQIQRLMYSERDPDGRITHIDDGYLPWSFHPLTNYHDVSYDRLGRLTQAVYTTVVGQGSTPNDKDDFAYNDSLGNLASKNGIIYGYDPLRPHVVATWNGQTVSHDADGNRTAKGDRTYAYDPFGRLATVADGSGPLVSDYYDESTQRVARFDEVSEALTHFHGSAFEIDGDEMVRHFYLGDRRVASDRVAAPAGLAVASASVVPVSGDGSVAAGRAPASYGFAGDGRGFVVRRAKAGPHAAAVVFVGLFGLALLVVTRPRRRRAALAVVCVYTLTVLPLPYAKATWGLVGVPEARAQSPGETVFYHMDHLGSPRVVTNLAHNVVEYVRYRAFGEIRGVFDVNGNPKDGISTRTTFTGQTPDEESDLIYFGARFYDPEMGLFLTPDPADQFASPYTYCNFDPLNATDPSGAFVETAIALLTCFAVAAAVAFVFTLAMTGGNLDAAWKAGLIAGVSAGVLKGISDYMLATEFVTESELSTLKTVYNLGQGVRSAATGDPFGAVMSFASAAGEANGQSAEAHGDVSNGVQDAPLPDPQVIGPDFEEGAQIPDSAKTVISKGAPKLKDALDAARLHHGSAEMFAKYATTIERTGDEVHAITIGYDIYVPPGEGLTLGSLTHEVTHVFQAMTIDDFGQAYRNERQRIIDLGVRDPFDRYFLNKYEVQARDMAHKVLMSFKP